MSKVFIDTNILVYALDSFDLVKQKKCRDILRTLKNDLRGVISTQVMQEFYVTATKKLNIEALIVKDILHSFRRFETVLVTPEIMNLAVDCQIINKISFWDSLIVAAAESANCEKLWTEDLNDGQTIRSVKVENPIKSLSEKQSHYRHL